jgi:hypothetical protein
MIIVCEPTVKSFSHEKVNSGFLYGLTLAYPGEIIRFYAHESHIAAMKSIASLDEIDFGNIEFVAIDFFNSNGLIQFFRYRFLFSKILSEAIQQKTNRIFFLSFCPSVLFNLKILKKRNKFSNFSFTLVLHGSIESIAQDSPTSLSVIPIPSIQKKSLKEQVRGKSIGFISKKILEKALGLGDRFPNLWKFISQKYLSDRRMLLWRPSKDFRYVALAPHVVANAKKYIDLEKVNFYSVLLPTVFKKNPRHISTLKVRFAVFGYGNSTMLYNVLLGLEKKKLSKPYEIRIISMDSRGTQGFANIVNTSPGRALSRAEMEKHVGDIDLFLILYDSTRYRLSCSGSILEALSYSKPILHFENECLSYFDRPDAPIGYSCNSIEEYVDRMADIIENFETYRSDLNLFGDNIEKLRIECSISASVKDLQRALGGP